jgi:3-oxoadipate enol-lactonase
MTIADINGIRMNYSIEGAGDPVVLITGFSGDISFWNSMVPLLSDSYKVITIDNRGAGKTTYCGPFTGEDMSDDIRALLDHLGIFKAHIVGWSMGGHIAQLFALRYPERVRTLTLISAYMYRPARSSYMMNNMIGAVSEGADIDRLGEMVNAFCFTENYFSKKERDGKPVRVSHGATLSGLKDQMAALDSFDTRDSLKAITAPTLEIHGLSDIMVEPLMGDQIADLIPGCKKYRIPDTGHIIHPALYINALKEHLSGN